MAKMERLYIDNLIDYYVAQNYAKGLVLVIHQPEDFIHAPGEEHNALMKDLEAIGMLPPKSFRYDGYVFIEIDHDEDKAVALREKYCRLDSKYKVDAYIDGVYMEAESNCTPSDEAEIAMIAQIPGNKTPQ